MILPSFKNVMELMDAFKDEAACRQYVKQLRWNGEPICPHCDHPKVYSYTNGKMFKCAGCHKKFSIITGTIFENTKIPLRKWFIAMYLVTANKKGISSPQLARQISVTQKTAWFLIARIQEIFKACAPATLGSVVEVDETYVGGKERNKHRDKRVKGQQGRGSTVKIPVFGLYDKECGVVRSMKVSGTMATVLQPLIHKFVEPGGTVISDEWWGYNGLEQWFSRSTVDHGRGQYANGDATTNSIEGYWSHLKRTYHGVHHSLSRKHIDRYLAGTDFRYNTRNYSDYDRFNLTLSKCQGRLRYSQLVASG